MKSTTKKVCLSKVSMCFILYEYKISVTKNVKTMNQIVCVFVVVFNQVEME